MEYVLPDLLFPIILCSMQSETDLQCFIHLMHGWRIECPHAILETAFINRANLFQQHNAVTGQSAAVCLYRNVCGQMCLIFLAGDGSCNDR